MDAMMLVKHSIFIFLFFLICMNRNVAAESGQDLLKNHFERMAKLSYSAIDKKNHFLSNKNEKDELPVDSLEIRQYGLERSVIFRVYNLKDTDFKSPIEVFEGFLSPGKKPIYSDIEDGKAVRTRFLNPDSIYPCPNSIDYHYALMYMYGSISNKMSYNDIARESLVKLKKMTTAIILRLR
jgi:hypothetical protein